MGLLVDRHSGGRVTRKMSNKQEAIARMSAVVLWIMTRSCESEESSRLVLGTRNRDKELFNLKSNSLLLCSLCQVQVRARKIWPGEWRAGKGTELTMMKRMSK